MVIYTTDHGENLGEHGLWWKNSMYEHAARIPLVISWPARWKGGQRRVGLLRRSTWCGRSRSWAGRPCRAIGTAPRCAGGWATLAAAWKDLAVSEYYAHNIASGFAMLRTGRYKYVYHTAADGEHPAQRELYDLESDPGEFTNLAGEARHAEMIGGCMPIWSRNWEKTRKTPRSVAGLTWPKATINPARRRSVRARGKAGTAGFRWIWPRSRTSPSRGADAGRLLRNGLPRHIEHRTGDLMLLQISTGWPFWCGCILMFVAAAVERAIKVVPNVLSMSALAWGILVAFIFGTGGPCAQLEGDIGSSIAVAGATFGIMLLGWLKRFVGGGCLKINRIWGLAGVCVAVSEGVRALPCGRFVAVVDLRGG